MFLPRKILEARLLQFLCEDCGQGDATTAILVSSSMSVEASVIAKESGTVAGIEEAHVLLESLGLGIKTSAIDGQRVREGDVVLKIIGDARTVLAVERTLLNILSRMSGIATYTVYLKEKLRKANIKTRVACTRKTAPGLLYFDKKAVQIGGGDTHRLHLDDMILIKDNHLALVGSVQKTVKKVRSSVSLSKKIEVEVAEVKDVVPAVKAGADIVMLDNFSPKQIRTAIELLKKEKCYGNALLEASGGIDAENIIEFASTGVDLVSLGEITQSPRSLDMSLEIKASKKD